MKRLLIPLITLLVLSLIFAGCSSSSTTPAASAPSTKAPVTTSAPVTSSAPTVSTAAPKTTALTSPSAAAGAPQTGGTLTYNISADPNSFWPPSMGGQTDGQTSSLALETLFRFDEQSNIVPLLATEWKADTAAKTITITLRKGVKFQDGSDFNAAVCKWNLDQYRTSARAELKNVNSVDVIDDSTVRLNLSIFNNTIINILANSSDAGRMISQKAFEANGGKAWAEKNPVGTGPFQLASWTKTVGITWKRFDGYWGGKPYLDGVQMKEYADQTVAVLDFKAGNLNMLRTSAPSDAKALQATGLYNVVIPVDGTSFGLIGFAKDPSPFAKVEMRQAVAYAIDAKSMSDSLGLGFWQVTNQWAYPGSSLYNNNVVGYPYNVQKAKDLLTKAGYPSGLNTTFNFWNINQIATDEATIIQNYLKAVGINVTLNALQRPGYTELASNGKGWTGVAMEFGFLNPDPLVRYATMLNGEYWAGTALPQEVLDTYKQAILATDAATKQKLTWQLSSLAVDKYCMEDFLFLTRNPIAKSKNVRNDLFGEVPFSYISPMAWLSK